MSTSTIDFDTLQRLKRPAVETAPIVMDPEWAHEAATARQKLAEADLRLLRDEEDPKAAAARRAALERLVALREARDQAEAAGQPKVVDFKFRALSRLEYQEVVDRNEPSPEDEEAAAKRGSMALWNSDTFPPDLVATALQSPRLTTDQVNTIWSAKQWSAGDLNALFLAAQRACTRRVIAPDFDDLDAPAIDLAGLPGFGDGLDDDTVEDLAMGAAASFT